MIFNYTKLSFQSLLTLFFALLLHSGISAQCTDAPPIVVPNAYTSSPGTASFTGLTTNSARTNQLLIHLDQLTNFVDKQLTGFTVRIPDNATAAWPTAVVTYTSYDIYLSTSVAPADRSLTFINNVVGPQTQVRAGTLTINPNAFPFGSSPNAFGVNIEFDTPYEYAGGHLLVEIRHTGFTGTGRTNDAIGTAITGYGTQFSAAWGSGYTATTGSQGNFTIVRLTAQECGPVIELCPTFSTAAPAVTVVNSACGANCSVTTGSITAPTGTCPAGSTLQYSTNGGGSWSTSLPTYNQTGPAQTIMTRCNCNVDTNISSTTSSVTTAPAGCALPSAPSISITNNVCPSTTGSISASGCGAGTVLEYATSSNGPWSTTAPAYTGEVFTVFARCRNTTTACISTISSANTAPEECSVCPDLSAAAPSAQVINSYCNSNCTLVAGAIGQANKCPYGTTVQYSTNSGSTWSTTVPTYTQGAAQTILTRCNCNIDTSLSSPTSSVTTAPADCVTLAMPVINITNNVCPSTTGTISASGCGAGTVVEYAGSPNGRWSTTPPNYNSTAFTVYARCRNTSTNCVSPVASATTAPTICPQFNGGGSESSLTFNVYPNPTYGEVNLDLKDYIGKTVQIELYSLEGTLMEMIREDEILQNTKTINMNGFTAGMYFVKLKSAGLPDVTKRVMLTK
jgi:hypothetical protein